MMRRYKRYRLLLLLGMLALAAYLSGPLIAGWHGVGDRRGPRLYPAALHEPFYQLAWAYSPHTEGRKARISGDAPATDRPWFYDLSRSKGEATP